jgi:hypothetical protein
LKVNKDILLSLGLHLLFELIDFNLQGPYHTPIVIILVINFFYLFIDVLHFFLEHILWDKALEQLIKILAILSCVLRRAG